MLRDKGFNIIMAEFDILYRSLTRKFDVTQLDLTGFMSAMVRYM